MTQSFFALSQTIERKIIIQNTSFYYTTIDDENQIGTLHTDSISCPLKKADKLALPAGRNYREPINPFSWDLKDSLMYAVSFLDHPLNSKMEALKRFKLSSLTKWTNEITAMDMIMKSVDQNMFAYNEPYIFTKQQSNVFEGFQFDGIVLHDSSYVMVIANNNQLTIWNYINKEWTHSEIQPFIIDGFFSLFEANKELYMILNNGNIHKVSKKQVVTAPYKITNKSLNDYILILNRDKNTFQLLKNNDVNTQIPFNEMIDRKAVSLF